MKDILVCFVLIFSVVSYFSLRVAYKYYKSNMINYHNSKMALLALEEYDRSFAVYMKSNYKNKNIIIGPEQMIFESIIEFLSKCKTRVAQYLWRNDDN